MDPYLRLAILQLAATAAPDAEASVIVARAAAYDAWLQADPATPSPVVNVQGHVPPTPSSASGELPDSVRSELEARRTALLEAASALQTSLSRRSAEMADDRRAYEARCDAIADLDAVLGPRPLS